MFKNTTMLEQSLLVLIFPDMVHCLIAWLFMTWASIDLQWVKIHFIRPLLCRRYIYVFTVFNNSSPLTFRLFITYNRHSTVFSLTKTEERLKNLSNKAASCLLSVNVEWRHSATHNTKMCLFCDGCVPFLNS